MQQRGVHELGFMYIKLAGPFTIQGNTAIRNSSQRNLYVILSHFVCIHTEIYHMLLNSALKANTALKVCHMFTFITILK